MSEHDSGEVHAWATQYLVSCLPPDDPEMHHWMLSVEWRGPSEGGGDSDRWAIKHSVLCLGADGKWGYELRPSERDDEWLETHRFPLERALELAKEAAPRIRVNGLTPAGLLEWRKERFGEDGSKEE